MHSNRIHREESPLKKYIDHLRMIKECHKNIRSTDGSEIIGGRTILCGNCGRIIAEAGDNADGFKGTFVCSCGHCGHINRNFSDTISPERSKAFKHPYKTDDGIFCPKCSGRLFAQSKHNFAKLSVYLKCTCGEVCSFKCIKLGKEKRI